MAKDEKNQQETPSAAGAGLGAKGAARRRFAKTGAGVSGVILTLASQPGMASQVCATPSGFLSGIGHNSHAPTATCAGRSPGYWKNNHDAWQLQAHTDGSVPCGSVFRCEGYTSGLKDYALFDVVDPTKITDHSTVDPDNVGMHLVATLLNVRAGIITVLDETRVLSIWTEYDSTHHYTPSAGATPWNGAQIVTYLTSTMT